MTVLPDKQTALKINADISRLESVQVPVPSPSSLGPGEILIEIKATGINHVENYFIDRNLSRPGCTLGCSMGGDVLAVAPDVTRFAKGDTIAAFVYAGSPDFKERGGFQKYSIVYECNALNIPLEYANQKDGEVIPPGPVTTYESAAAIVCNIVTIGASIYYAFGHTDEKNKTIIIYGGATGVGQLAIQYCHRIGWRVIAIASSKHEEHLKQLGADVVVDYHTGHLGDDIRALNEDVDFYYITAGQRDGMTAFWDCVRTDKPVKMESLEVPDISYLPAKPNVDFGYTRAFTCHGKVINYGDVQYTPRENLFQKILEYIPMAEKLVQEGKFTETNIKILPGGLDSVAEGLRMLKSGEVRNMRLVTRV